MSLVILKAVKRPVEIEYIKFEYSATGIAAMKEFLGDNLGAYFKQRHPGAVGKAKIITLEGGEFGDAQVDHIAEEGDYIIKGVAGEFYPCKPDIFHATYIKLSHDEASAI